MGIYPININVNWVLTGYLIRPNYDPSIISINHQTPTPKYPKTTKKTKIPMKSRKFPKYPINIKSDIKTPPNLKMAKIPLEPKK